jgi:pimeloyl-ACP methyl ester carboxylesterase
VVIGLSAALVYLLLVGFTRLSDRLILFPTTAKLDAGTAQRRIIPLDGGELEIWVARSDAPPADRFVLRFYGNADRADRWAASEAQGFAGQHVELWGVNYPGFGGSTGRATLPQVARAALAAFDVLQKEAAGKPVFVIGTSLGTTAALHVGAERPVAGLVLQNPPALPELIVGQHGWWNLWLLAAPVAWRIPAALDSVANARKIRSPAVFSLAENDEVVPPKYQNMVVDAYGGSKTVLVQAGAKHNTPMDPEFRRRFRDALDGLMKR